MQKILDVMRTITHMTQIMYTSNPQLSDQSDSIMSHKVIFYILCSPCDTVININLWQRTVLSKPLTSCSTLLEMESCSYLCAKNMPDNATSLYWHSQVDISVFDTFTKCELDIESALLQHQDWNDKSDSGLYAWQWEESLVFINLIYWRSGKCYL